MRLPIVMALALASLAAIAQPMPMNQPDLPLDKRARDAVLAATATALEKSYVYPEAGARMADALRRRQAAGEYDAVASPQDFARRLTEHLQEVSHDKHVGMHYSAAALPPQRDPGEEPSGAQAAQRERVLRSLNYGFERAERLERNVGYLELRSFQATGPQAEEVAAAAMTFLANTDALIIDLRRNGGGDPGMVAFVTSYLFDGRTHLNDLYWRERDRTDEFWTSPEVPGRKFGGSKPVFVLTSKRTFSGAEEFANNLKALKRATIVGETTGGGAHPGEMRRLDDHFTLFVPTGRAINPITKTNWEGTGVEPDVAVAADQALDKARELALEAMARKRGT
jgi:hypothetical protein